MIKVKLKKKGRLHFQNGRSVLVTYCDGRTVFNVDCKVKTN